jgi:hypothetical protein
MSHQEKIERMNAELNTSEAWERRWQIEREHNERLNAKALRLRGEVLELRRAAMERAANNQRYAGDARSGEDARRAEVYERLCVVQSGMVRALDDVIAAMDRLSTEP